MFAVAQGTWVAPSWRRFSFPLLLALALLTGLAGEARAARSKTPQQIEAQRHFEKGMAAYNLGRFPDAIQWFTKAYELVPTEPVFLYNIAQAHRQNANPERAAFFYRRYLKSAPRAKNRAEVERRVAEMDAAVAARAAPPTGPVPRPVQPSEPAPAPPVIATAAPAPVEPAREPHPGRGLRLAGLTTAGVGVAAVVTGIIFYSRSNSLYDEATKAAYDGAKDDSAHSARTLGHVFTGIGAAAVAGGAVLYYLGHRAGKAGATVAITPVLTAAGGGAMLSGRF